MRANLSLLLLGLLLTAGAGQLAAQSTGSVQGTVTTSDGVPVEAATVTATGTGHGAVTRRDGSFLVKDLPAGRYTIAVTRIGLARQEREVTITAGERARLDFAMAETGLELQGITVNSSRSVNSVPVAIGKVAIPPMDLPQSVAVVDHDVLERQQVLHLGDALKNVNGVYVMGTSGGTQEELAGRGFALGSTSTFKNGVRFNNAVMPEMSSLERLEVLKGSSAILFGNVSAGGVINMVTKKPRFEQGGEISMRVGSYDLYKPTIDVYGPLLGSTEVAYRLGATYERGNSFRQSVGSERVYINPSFLAELDGETSILVEADYLKDDRTLDYGTGAINYAIADVPRDRFLGAGWSYSHIAQSSAMLTATRGLGQEWELRGVAGYQSYGSDLFGTTRPNAGTLVQSDGKWIRGVQRSQVNEQYALGQIDLSGHISTGFLDHRVLVGFDADRYRTETIAYENIAKYDSINILNPDMYQQRGDIPDLKPRTTTTSPVYRAGLYVQDLIGIADQVKLLAGVRWSYQETGSNVFINATGATTYQTSFDDAITPRLGLVYQPLRSVSLFASYANSFTLNTGVDINGDALPPSFIDQYEVGVKSDWLDGLFSTNVTLYQIVNSNLAQTSLANGNTNSNIKELAGEVTSKGVEVDLSTRRWSGVALLAGYSYNRTTYTASNTYEVGSELRYNPAHTANASISYEIGGDGILRGLELGAGALYIGDRVAGRSTRLTVKNDAYKLMPIPSFTQFDLSASYQWSDLAVSLKVSNLFDVLSYYVHDDNSVNPIAPRTYSVTTKIRL